MPTLLIVDDIAGVHDMLDLVFEGTGIDLVHALLAPQAIEIYQRENIDAVLSDIHMPGMDGLELFQELKIIDPAVTMIMTTATESREYVIKALRMGAFDYVEKPYDEADLVSIIRRAINERKKRLNSEKGLNAGGEEVEALKKQLAERDQALAQAQANTEELVKLREELSAQKDLLKSSEQKRKELDKQRMELEVREGTLMTMESVLKERMAKLKDTQKKQLDASGLSPEEAEKLSKLKAELESREAELHTMETSIQEREAYIMQTEESLMEKGMRLQELEAELEQMREDLENSGGASGAGVSPEAQKDMEALQAKLAEKEEAMADMQSKIRDKERSIKKAEALVKAREAFLAQSEAILLGEEQ